MKTQIANTTLELTQGDIANQPDIEAVVNAANAELQIGGAWPGPFAGLLGPGWPRKTRSAQ